MGHPDASCHENRNSPEVGTFGNKMSQARRETDERPAHGVEQDKYRVPQPTICELIASIVILIMIICKLA